MEIRLLHCSDITFVLEFTFKKKIKSELVLSYIITILQYYYKVVVSGGFSCLVWSFIQGVLLFTEI